MRPLLAAALVALAAPAHAGVMNAHWWNGDWSCSVGGQTMAMRWRLDEDGARPQRMAGMKDLTASEPTGAGVMDGGGARSPIRFRTATPAMLKVEHAGGETWTLQRRSMNRMTGEARGPAGRRALDCRRA